MLNRVSTDYLSAVRPISQIGCAEQGYAASYRRSALAYPNERLNFADGCEAVERDRSTLSGVNITTIPILPASAYTMAEISCSGLVVVLPTANLAEMEVPYHSSRHIVPKGAGTAPQGILYLPCHIFAL